MTLAREHLKQFEPYQKRNFLKVQDNLLELQTIVQYCEKLLACEIKSTVDLEQWLMDRSELEAAIDQQSSILYILMTCQTDDEARADAYRKFIEEVVPEVKPYDDKLDQFLLEYHAQYPLPTQRYGIYIQQVQEDVRLFVEKNIPLETRVDVLSQEYQTLCAKMMVDFGGEEQTLPQMEKYQQEPDRALRERAWRAVAQRRLKEKDALNEIFNEMLQLRHAIALNSGCANYIEYRFRSLHRFDYTSKDCYQYHASVEKAVVPVWRKILQRRKKLMGREQLRPWDTSVDPLGRLALKPFSEVEKLIDGCQKIFQKVDSQLGERFKKMKEWSVLDLASRKGKAPGGYQSTLNETRRPFIFMNAVGLDSDVRTLLHEGGHAFHALECAAEPLLDYRHAPMEFCEVASMSMELLGGEFLSEFYSAPEQQRSVIEHLEDVIFILVWVAVIDCFQHWIYENPQHSIEEREAAWLSIRRRFASDEIEWSGLDDVHASLWHRQLHIFEVPFYYIEYGIAQLGALQVWLNSRDNFKNAVALYRRALALGGSKSLPELFKAAGINFDFSERTIVPLVNMVEEKIFEA